MVGMKRMKGTKYTHTYHLEQTYWIKSEAKRLAKAHRKKGRHSRVVYTSHVKPWAVYSTKPVRKRRRR